MKYYQCRLSKGTERTVEWIEQKGAITGRSVKFLPENEFWTVDEVYQFGIEEQQFRQMQDLHRKWHNNI